jgi:hypothetical protein
MAGIVKTTKPTPPRESVMSSNQVDVIVIGAGDITGRLMLVPEAIQDGFVAATNAVRGPTMPLGARVSPSGSFTDRSTPRWALSPLLFEAGRAGRHSSAESRKKALRLAAATNPAARDAAQSAVLLGGAEPFAVNAEYLG